jgi:hypothetical protein
MMAANGKLLLRNFNKRRPYFDGFAKPVMNGFDV